MKKIFLLFFILLCPFSVLALDMVEINTASLQQLDTLIGIGPTYAQRIIDARPFSSVDDLIRVSGIGEKTLQKIKDQGLVYVENQIIQPILQTSPETSLEAPPTAPAEPLDMSPTETPPQDAVVPIVYPTGIVINEILPSPEGADESEEWIEIQNQNNFEIDLSDWKIKDTIGRVVAYVFPIGSKIPSKGFLILKRPQTKISLNNTGDGLNLFSPDGKIRDSVSFKKAPLGQSYNKTAAGWEWSTTLTPNSANIILGKEEIKKGATPSSTPNEETTVVELSPKKQTAAASAAAAKLPKNLLPILISIPLALFSALLIFLLKKYLTKQS